MWPMKQWGLLIQTFQNIRGTIVFDFSVFPVILGTRKYNIWFSQVFDWDGGLLKLNKKKGKAIKSFK